MPDCPPAPAQPLDAPEMPEWRAPAHWQAVDVIADLHLNQSEPATAAAWRRYMLGTPASAVIILGDLFEAWIGDDAAGVAPDDAQPAPAFDFGPGFEADCARVLREAAARRPVAFMRGNRDFLVGAPFLAACGVRDLPDPIVLTLHGQRWLLSHGDALCLNDVAYQQFRRQSRQAAWQRQFLALPLPQRRALARQMREQSSAHQQAQDPATWADVDAAAAHAWLQAARALVLIHGHTHRPALHDLGAGLQRIVLSDWQLDGPAPRAEVLRLLPGQTPARLTLEQSVTH